MIKKNKKNLKPSKSGNSDSSLREGAERMNANIIKRPPVVVIIGHVDSGKTSLLDYIRKAHIAEKESGGITQHIGAYQVTLPPAEAMLSRASDEAGEESRPIKNEILRSAQDDFAPGGHKITFIDTPGHEAFSAMRQRGAKVADIAVLMVDTTKGVQQQTKEAISHIKLAGIPIIVALNKTDRPESNLEKAKGELAKEDILVESMGGTIPSVEMSTKTGQGIEELLEVILLITEMENLTTDMALPAQGVIIESYLDSQKGPTATAILGQGKLETGQIMGTPSAFGRIKSMENFQGDIITSAFPSDPVVILGFENVPKVGEEIKVFLDIETAKSAMKVSERKESSRVLEIKDNQKVMNIILKVDFVGSLEALEGILNDIPQEKVVLRILKSEVGEVNETDIRLAISGHAKIFGFRVKIDAIAVSLAQREKIKIRQFDVIYSMVEDVRMLMERAMDPEIVRKDLGKMKITVIFLVEKNRQIVGGKIIFGEIKKGTLIEVLRNNEKVGQGKISGLQINKKVVERATKGQDCGIMYDGNVKIETGDVLVFYIEERIRGGL